MLTLHAPPLFNGSLMQLAKCPFHTGHFCIIPGAPKINIENDSSGFWKAGWSLCFLPTYTWLLIYQISAGRGGACKANKTRDTQKTQQAGANSDQTAASAVQSWISRGWMGGCLTVCILCLCVLRGECVWAVRAVTSAVRQHFNPVMQTDECLNQRAAALLPISS